MLSFLQEPVARLISNFDFLSPGVKSNLIRVFNHGALSGTGKILILPVDQGFEHGPDMSFSKNAPAYNPKYHAEFALNNGFSAAAFPLGIVESIASEFAGLLPIILKVNHGDSLFSDSDAPSQSIVASAYDAVRLGCVGVGYTIYPGSSNFQKMLSDFAKLREVALNLGLIVVVWSYPRGGKITKEFQTALDVISYAAHIAALSGAHIIKVKLPDARVFDKKIEDFYNLDSLNSDFKNSLSKRVAIVKRSSLNRILVFSGGASKDSSDLLSEIKSISDGGGNGSIIGRNAFQRPCEEASGLIRKVIDEYIGS